MRPLIVAVMILMALTERGTRPIKEAVIIKEITVQWAAKRL